MITPERFSGTLLGNAQIPERDIYRAEAHNYQPPTSSDPIEKIKSKSKNKLAIGLLSASLALSGCASHEPVHRLPPLGFIGVDTMNMSKDRLRDPLTLAQKTIIAERAKELGVTHVAIDTPYDAPSTLDPITETEQWLEAVRSQKLSVIHRHMFSEFEGIFGMPKNTSLDYIQMMKQYMLDHPNFIQPGDIWVPMPEPQNAGIVGVNCEPNNLQQAPCMFSSAAEFNTFIQDAVQVSRNTLQQMGKKDVRVLCCGFDGYISWGDNNPQRQGQSFIDQQTLTVMGSIMIDHYPQPDPQGQPTTYADGLKEAHEVLPNVPVYISEFGPNRDPKAEPLKDTMETFANDPLVLGISYFQMGPSGSETLLNPDFSEDENFKELQQGYRELRKDRGVVK